MIKVKICGIQELWHLKAAVESGASYVGFVFFENSRRNVSTEIAQKLANQVPNEVVRVALMVDPSDAFIARVLDTVSIDMLQLHGHETVERVRRIKDIMNVPVMKAIGISDKSDLAIIKEYEIVADQILLDAKPSLSAKVPGGLGRPFDWSIINGFEFKKPWLLAGGLNSQNVQNAIKQTGATGVDVSSGVEDEYGTKSATKIVEFLNILKGDPGE
jgi:phosphoribosylanthranilate isomerase